MGVRLSTAKLHLSCKLHFQDAPGCLQANSSLEPAPSLSLSLAHRSMLLKSHKNTRYLLCAILSPSSASEGCHFFFSCLFYLPVSLGSQRLSLTATTPWAARQGQCGHSQGPPLLLPMACCTTAAELHPEFLISMPFHASLALVSPFDHWIQFCRNSDVSGVWMILLLKSCLWNWGMVPFSWPKHFHSKTFSLPKLCSRSKGLLILGQERNKKALCALKLLKYKLSVS